MGGCFEEGPHGWHGRGPLPQHIVAPDARSFLRHNGHGLRAAFGRPIPSPALYSEKGEASRFFLPLMMRRV